MIKSELVARVAANAKALHPRHVETIVEAILDEIALALAAGNRVELRDFGIFYVKQHRPRLGRNPKTGEMVDVAGKFAPRFKPG